MQAEILLSPTNVLDVGLLVTLIILALLHWRLRHFVHQVQPQLRQRLETLNQDCQRIQRDLEHVQALLESTQLAKVELEAQTKALKHHYSHRLNQLSQEVRRDTQALIFEQIQTLLAQYPTLRRMIQSKPYLPALNLVAILTPLDDLIQVWGYVPIGTPWEPLPYDPQLHQGDVGDLQVGETVYVQFVGYREIETNRILLPAQVSRTSPREFT